MEETRRAAPSDRPAGRTSALLRDLLAALRAPVPWTGSRPARVFLGATLAIVAGILLLKIALDSPIRLQVYVIEVGVISLLGFVVLEGEKLRQLASQSSRADLAAPVAGGPAMPHATRGVA